MVRMGLRMRNFFGMQICMTRTLVWGHFYSGYGGRGDLVVRFNVVSNVKVSGWKVGTCNAVLVR